ncbi:MAG: DUF333 domain-containing protein [Acidobacteriaceae bacterium]
MKIIAFALFSLALFAATARAQNASSKSVLIGVFEGTLPCADCEGIDTRLALYAKGPFDNADATYRLTLTYMGRKSHFTQTGAWTILRGMPGNPDATLYQLDPGKPNAASYLRVGEDELKQLDHHQHIIDSKLNFSLHRVPAGRQSSNTGLANPASVNCAKQGGKLDIRNNSSGGEYGMCMFPNGKQCEEWALFRKQCSAT